LTRCSYSAYCYISGFYRPVLPVLNTNINQSANTDVSSLSGRVRPFLGLRLLLIISAILLLVVVFVIGFPQVPKKSQLQKQIDVLVQELKASSGNTQFASITSSSLNRVPLFATKLEQYKQLYNLTQGISAEYAETHNPKIRVLIGHINEFARNEYPAYYQKSGFFVLCLDEECGKLKYDPEILAIKKSVEASNMGVNKETILSALYNASIIAEGTSGAEINRKRDSLIFALLGLHDEAEKGNVTAKQSEQKLTDYFKKMIPNFRPPWEVTVLQKDSQQ